MVALAKEVGKKRYRESYGRYLEDFEIGDVYEHRPGRTITESDNTWFTLLTMNQHPLHFDAEYAAKSEFGKPVVNSCLTLSIVAGMSVSDISQKTIANLGWDKIQLLSKRADKIRNGCQTCSTGLESVRNGSAVLVLVGKVLRHVGENQIRDKCASDNEGHR